MFSPDRLQINLRNLQGYIWDWAINLGSDYQLLFKHRVYYPTVIYYLSRELSQWSGAESPLWDILSQAFFGGAVIAPFSVSGGHIGPTQACIVFQVDGYAEATAIASMINDSAVFFAITYRILVNSIFEENPSSMPSLEMVDPFYLHSPETFFEGGNITISLSGNILLLVMGKTPNLPLFYSTMCTVTVLAVTNSMACIVYRQIKFGLINVDGSIDLHSFGSFKAASEQTATNSSILMHIEPRGSAAISKALGSSIPTVNFYGMEGEQWRVREACTGDGGDFRQFDRYRRHYSYKELRYKLSLGQQARHDRKDSSTILRCLFSTLDESNSFEGWKGTPSGRRGASTSARDESTVQYQRKFDVSAGETKQRVCRARTTSSAAKKWQMCSTGKAQRI
ncbi:hypothetical protein L218DRAFT_949261 [Marasmius fiardii PR-910]|nr:hypothetical protein L218DRAFT_949261 [Marasmius fiardii PR-910]